jgi:hypothetical protein
VQERESIHLGHLDIECQDVGIEILDLVARDVGIACDADHLDLGIGIEHVAQNAADQRGIVDDEHADFLTFCAHVNSSTSPPASRLRMLAW